MDPKELEFPQEKEGWGPNARHKGSLSSQKKKFFMLTIFWIAGTRRHTYYIPLPTLDYYVYCIGMFRVSGDAFLMRAARSQACTLKTLVISTVCFDLMNEIIEIQKSETKC